MDNLLFVSYIFPPSIGARGLQVAKLAKYVARMGVEVDVITLERGSDGAGADWLGSPNGLRVHPCTPGPGRFGDGLRRQISDPSAMRWREAAIDCGRNLVSSRSHLRPCIVSFAMPMHSHVVGLALKSRFPDVTWVAHFSDPWAMHPYPKVGNPGNVWKRPFMKRLESNVIRRADAVLFVSDSLRDYMIQHYPDLRRKSAVVPHMFDPEMYGGEVEQACPTRLKVVYVGGFNRVRGVAPLLGVIEDLRRRGTDLAQLEIEFVGKGMEPYVELVNRIVPGLAGSPGEVTYLESLRRMAGASVLLLVDANVEPSPFFPSKLADYIGSGRPIIGISPASSCSTKILARLGMASFSYSKLEEAASFLEHVIRGEFSLAAPPLEKMEEYSGPLVAQRFLDTIGTMARSETWR